MLSGGGAPVATFAERPWPSPHQQLIRLSVVVCAFITTRRDRLAVAANATQKPKQSGYVSEEAYRNIHPQNEGESHRELHAAGGSPGNGTNSKEKLRELGIKSRKCVRLCYSLFPCIMEEGRMSFVYVFCSFVPLALLGLLLEAALFIFSAVVQVQYWW